jgi:hypothetical protein
MTSLLYNLPIHGALDGALFCSEEFKPTRQLVSQDWDELTCEKCIAVLNKGWLLVKHKEEKELKKEDDWHFCFSFVNQ